VHGIYQFDEAVQAISALKTPLRTGFLPVCLVHARTKLVDVYDVRPVNAEEEGLPFGPYNYPSFPPLNQDMQRVAVDNQFSPSDVPDVSQLVTVDIESISGSARRGSRDSATDSDSENRQSIELESGLPQQTEVLDVSRNVSGGSEDGSDPSDHQNRDCINQDGDIAGAAGSDFVSIESIVAPLKLSEDFAIRDDIKSEYPQPEVVLDAEEANLDCGSSQDNSHHTAVSNERCQSSFLLGEAGIQSRPGEVISDACEDEVSGDASSEREDEVSGDASSERDHELAEDDDGPIVGENRSKSPSAAKSLDEDFS